jgi:hypothetical protein
LQLHEGYLVRPFGIRKREMEAKLKEKDIIKVKEPVAAVEMEAGDCYTVEYIKKRFNEEYYCMSRCDDTMVIKEVDLKEVSMRSLDFWLATDSIEIIGFS